MKDTAKLPAGPDDGAEPAKVDKAENAQEAGYYGLRILPPFSAVAELAAIVTLLLIVDWIWPALDINNIQPSPYWLPVLMLTLQYGTASGTLAVVVAIIAYFSFVTLPEQGVGENEFAYRLRILSQPILWIATAVVLGQFRMVQIAAKRELRQRLAELKTQRDTLADYASRLRARCDALERDIAARPIHAGAPLLNAFAALGDAQESFAQETYAQESFARDSFIKAVEAAFAHAFPAATLSLFARSDAGLTKLAATPWAADAKWSATLAPDHVLAKSITGAKSKLSVLHAADEEALAGQGLAAVPVIEPASGKVIGMIKLEFAGSRVLSADLLRQLDVLAAAVEPGLARHLASERTAQPKIGLLKVGS